MTRSTLGPWRRRVRLAGLAATLAPLLAASGLPGQDVNAGPDAPEASAFEVLNSGRVFPAGLPLAEAVRVDRTLYLSGQIGIVPGTLELVEGGLRAEARQTMENIRTSLEAHGYGLDDVVKCTVMLEDMSRWSEFNEVYGAYFADHHPARSAFGTTGLALGAAVEVECMAVGPASAPTPRNEGRRP